MIKLSIRFGCYISNSSKDDLIRMELFGEKLGLAFQIVDDILDVEGNQQSMGKSIGKDAKVKKATFPAVYGLEKSRVMAQNLIEEAKLLLEPYGHKAELLLLLSDFLLTRKF